MACPLGRCFLAMVTKEGCPASVLMSGFSKVFIRILTGPWLIPPPCEKLYIVGKLAHMFVNSGCRANGFYLRGCGKGCGGSGCFVCKFKTLFIKLSETLVLSQYQSKLTTFRRRAFFKITMRDSWVKCGQNVRHKLQQLHQNAVSPTCTMRREGVILLLVYIWHNQYWGPAWSICTSERMCVEVKASQAFRPQPGCRIVVEVASATQCYREIVQVALTGRGMCTSRINSEWAHLVFAHSNPPASISSSVMR